MKAGGLMPTPRSVDIAITGRCNLSCQYCFYSNEMAARSDLSTKQWLAFFDELSKLGVMDVCLTGGEVFTRRDLFEIIDGLINNHMRYTLLTNGTLINEKIIEQLHNGKRLQRLNYIQVSIDGSRAEVHDLSRPKSFTRTVRGLKLLKKAKLPLTVRVTINRHNLEDLENTARFLLEEIGLASFSTNEASPIGAGCQNEANVSLTPIDQAKAMKILSQLMERYPGQLLALAGPQAKIQMHAEMEYARRTGEKSTRWGMGHLTGCGCVFNKISVLHDGSIVPCHLLSGVVLGNLTKDSLVDIWRNAPELNALRERRNIPMKLVTGCTTCEWNEFCNGSCPGLAHQLTGDFNQADPGNCYRKFLAEMKLSYEFSK